MRHHHHHKDNRRPSPATIDSRPRPLAIPNRISNVRSLIDFFNTQAFTEKHLGSSSSKRRLPDPVFENKVKSLVINFTRLESLSAPATAATSPIKSKGPPTPWRRSRPASVPDSRATPAKSILKPLKHVSYKLDTARREDVGDVEEITVSGGDRRETTYKKSQEPLRTVKVWKEQHESRADKGRWPDSGRGKEPERPYQERARGSKHPNYAVPDDGAQGFVSRTSPPTGKYRRKGRSKRAGDGSDGSSTSQSYTTPPIESPVEQSQGGWNSRGLKSPPATTIIPTPSTAYVTPARPWNERTKAPVAVASADYRVLKAPKGPSVIAMEPLSSKYPSIGRVKTSLTTTFGGTMRQNSILRNDGASSSKQRSPTKAKDDSWMKKDKAMKKRVPAEFETSQSETSNITPEPPKNRKPTSRGKTPLIITTEASPSESGFPDIDSVVQQVMSNPPSLLTGPESTISPEYSTMKHPRTFKDIALQRREERKRAALELPTAESEDQGHLSVPSMSAPTPVAPLRVAKPKDPDVPTIQNPVPLKRLYSKASQDTLTSFEEPSIEVSDSTNSSEEEENSNLRSTPSPAIGLQYQRPSREELRPPMRSPSLMREMAPPRLTLRTTSSMSHTSVSQATEASQAESSKKHKHKRPALTQQHFAPRMKLKRDDEWMAVARNRQYKRSKHKGGSNDGPNDTRPRTAQSSTSHDTTVSSNIVAKKVIVRPLKNQDGSQSQSSGTEEPRDRDRRQREGDVRLMSSMQRGQRSKVNFSGFAQNFPADEYESGRRVGDRTTAIDGVDEANPIVLSRVKVDRKGNIQKFEEGGAGSARKRKKKPKDRPKMG